MEQTEDHLRRRQLDRSAGPTARPLHDAAKIRAFFIHPAWARRGIGTLLLDACEAAARSAGFTRYEMGATLTGVRLFRARGYLLLEHLDVPLGEGLTIPVVHVEKRT